MKPRTPLLALLVLLVVVVGCSGRIGDPGSGGGASGGGANGGAAGNNGNADPGELVIGPALARRLTKQEYGYSVEDLLGVKLGADLDKLPDEDLLGSFSNNAISLTVRVENLEAYVALAPVVVDKIADFDGFIARHSSCNAPFSDTTCRARYIQSVGALMFRRPLDARELALFDKLFGAVLAEGVDFERAAKAVLDAMLQSPPFLYRLERQHIGSAGERRLDPFELASRLSYMIWLSAPDAELAAAAAGGKLSTPLQIAAQVKRMLAVTNKAKRSTERFIRDLMRLDTLADPGHQREGLTAGLGVELANSVVAFYQDHVFAQRATMASLYTSRRAFLTPTLAQWYKLPSAGPGLLPYDTSSRPERVGLLTQPGVLAGMSDRDVGGLVARGLFMERNVFCSEFPTPPPPSTIDIAAEKTALGPEATPRQYAENRLGRDACKGCHGRFEPLAFGFERFDGVGRYTTENDYGRALRTDGWITPAANDSDDKVPYSSIAEYMQLLAESPRVQRCLTSKFLEYALGREMTSGDKAAIHAVYKGQLAGGDDYAALLLAVAQHDIFSLVPTE